MFLQFGGSEEIQFRIVRHVLTTYILHDVVCQVQIESYPYI